MLTSLVLLALTSQPAHATLGASLRVDCGDGPEEVDHPDLMVLRGLKALTVIYADGDDTTKITVKHPEKLNPIGILINPLIVDEDEDCTVIAGLATAEYVEIEDYLMDLEELDLEEFDATKSLSNRVVISVTQTRVAQDYSDTFISTDTIGDSDIVITDTSSGFWTGAGIEAEDVDLGIVITDTSAG